MFSSLKEKGLAPDVTIAFKKRTKFPWSDGNVASFLIEIWIRKIVSHSNCCLCVNVCFHYPVSYTQLDVYKRQV